MIRLIFLGDVVGEPGRLALYRALPLLREQYQPHALIVNGENAAGGKGLTPKIAQEFFRNGVDAITLGDHAWDQNDLIPWLEEEPRVLRPFNMQANCPGHGSLLLDSPAGKLGILVLQGRTFMRVGAENPFLYGREEAARLREAGARAVLVDIHAETSSEKIALGYHLDGIASAVIGTHTHVQSNDARVLAGGCAFMSDAGMCGPLNGVIGRDAEAVIDSFVSCMPRRFPVADWPARISGVYVEIDAASGKAHSIHPLNLDFEK